MGKHQPPTMNILSKKFEQRFHSVCLSVCLSLSFFLSFCSFSLSVLRSVSFLFLRRSPSCIVILDVCVSTFFFIYSIILSLCLTCSVFCCQNISASICLSACFSSVCSSIIPLSVCQSRVTMNVNIHPTFF